MLFVGTSIIHPSTEGVFLLCNILDLLIYSYKADCQYPQKFPEYLDNLHRLGIVEVYYERFLVDEKYYEELKHQPYFPHIEENEKINIVEKKSMYELSEFGKEFCKVCLY